MSRAARAVVLGGLLLAACGAEPAAAPETTATGAAAPATGPAVLVVGDSITSQTCDTEVEDLVRQCETYTTIEAMLQEVGLAGATVTAQWGRTATEGLALLEALATLPPVVVVALGTNDVLRLDSDIAPEARPAALRDVVDAVVALAGPERRVVWVNLRLDGTWADTIAAEANRLLAAADAAIPTLAVADWHAHAAEHPEWFDEGRVHLTPDGAVAWRSFLQATLGSWHAAGWR